MKKIIYFLLCFATAANAGLFDKDIKVRIYITCDNKNVIKKDDVVLWNFTVEKNSVIQKQEVYLDKTLKQSDLKRLENYIIVDKANWKCGGEESIRLNGEVYVGTSHQAINGKYTYLEYAKKGTQISNQTVTSTCKIEQLN